MNRPARVSLVTLALALAFAGCPRPGKPLGPLPGGKPLTPQEAVLALSKKPGFSFRLREGGDGPARREGVELAAASKLSDAETRAVLDRLPPQTKKPGDEKDFALREKSLPPPRTGQTIKDAFPPRVTAPPPDVGAPGALRVLRHAPDGEVPLAPHVSLTFSQPMVAVTSHAEHEKLDVPVRMSPRPPGRFRWVGAKTLLFEPEGAERLPMATDYVVEVPAGTRSTVGGALAAVERFTFSTPAPVVRNAYPQHGPVRRDPVLFVLFDQRIAAAAVLESIAVQAGAARPRLRLATDEEIAADKIVSSLAENAQRDQAGRYVAFRAVDPLPAATTVGVEVGPGTPSAEGPKRTTKAHAFAFTTYGPMRVDEARCGWNEECPPGTPWQVRFSNPIDAKRFDRSLVAVDPPLPGMKIAAWGQYLTIQGRSRGRTTYRVTLNKGIPDDFGQVLEQDTTVTFNVTSAQPAFFAQGGPLVVLDPAAGPRFSVYTVNHRAVKLRAWSVAPEDWPRYQAWMRDLYEHGWDRWREPPGRRAIDGQVRTEGHADEIVETRLDLSRALQGGLGHAIVVVEPAVKRRDYHERIVAWVQATRIGLSAFVDASDLVAYASSLADGKPLDGVALEIQPPGVRARTGAGGLATLPLASAPAQVLAARHGGDTAILPQDPGWWGGGGWQRWDPGESLVWWVANDRGMYRPGEEVKVKGWIRRVGQGKGGDVGPLGATVRAIRWTLIDSVGNEVAKGERDVGGLGGFDVTLKLPPTMNLGHAQLSLRAEPSGGDHYHAFQVQEFRRPEFEVSATANEGPFFVGGGADLAVAATYYAGGGLPNAETTWTVTATPAWFTPPNRDDYRFGAWEPWWAAPASRHRRGDDAGEEPRTRTLAGRTDGTGRHRLRADFLGANPPRATSVHAEATVMDVNRQAWTASSDLLVHPSNLYVGLRTARAFVDPGQPIEIDAIVADLDGGLISGREIAVRAVRLDWEQEGDEWVRHEKDTQLCTIRSAAGAGRCTFKATEGGEYQVTATIADDRGRPNLTTIAVWVAGGKMPPQREVAQEPARLLPDKKEYRAGDMAEVLVIAPFAPAEGVATLRRSGIVRTERFSMATTSTTLRVRIEEAWTPNVWVQVDLAGAASRSDDAGRPDPKLARRPAYAMGTISLAIPPAERRLALDVRPREAALDPGGTTTVDLTLRDAAGRPVAGGEAAIAVVDESVLALSGHRWADPLGVFYGQRAAGANDYHERAWVLLAKPEEARATVATAAADGAPGKAGRGGMLMPMEGAAPAPTAAAPRPERRMSRAREGEAEKHKAEVMFEETGFGAIGGEAAAKTPIRMRTDFSALAFFAASVPTDAQGRAQVVVKVPDNLTRYRVMAVAVAGGKQFGAGESAITARLPLMVRPSAPRFLNFGDRFELPVVIQNQTERPMQVDVAARAVNADLGDGAGRRVTVPANDRVELRFPAAAAMAGKARFQVGGASGRFADANEFELPVWTPATTEAFATYGVLDRGAIIQPVRAPEDMWPQFGGLEITTSSTALQALTDAFLYLVSYPFECSEQIASRVLAVAALKDVLDAFKAAGMPPKEEVLAAMSRDLERLKLRQNPDGGFALWRRGEKSWPWVAVHVGLALALAKEKGFAVDDGVLARSREHLRNIERHIPGDYPEDVRRAIVAYALYVRGRMNDRDPGKARALLREKAVDKWPLEGLGFLLSVMAGDGASASEVAAIRHHLGNRVEETAAAAHFTTSYSDGNWLLMHSDRRADAVVLEAMIAAEPGSDLIPKIVEGLLGHRKQGRWGSTQENAFVLLALDRYFHVYEKTTPDFVARAWLGERYAGEHVFRGRTTERHHVDIPMRAVAAAQKGDARLVLAKDGEGRMYYRIGMQYAPSSLRLAPADYGFAVERAYEPVDDPRDLRRDDDGTWRVRAGSRVRVKLSMVASARRYHVALVDPLPAGFEALNPALAVTGTVPADDDERRKAGGFGTTGYGTLHRWRWWGPWYEHENLRDERVEAFTSLLWEGVYTYAYVARATTPGTFVVPPTKAEEMYHPETFGRAATDRVVVE